MGSFGYRVKSRYHVNAEAAAGEGRDVIPQFFLYASLCHAEFISASRLYEVLKRVQDDKETKNGLKTEKTDPLRRDASLISPGIEFLLSPPGFPVS